MHAHSLERSVVHRGRGVRNALGRRLGRSVRVTPSTTRLRGVKDQAPRREQLRPISGSASGHGKPGAAVGPCRGGGREGRGSEAHRPPQAASGQPTCVQGMAKLPDRQELSAPQGQGGAHPRLLPAPAALRSRCRAGSLRVPPPAARELPPPLSEHSAELRKPVHFLLPHPPRRGAALPQLRARRLPARERL